MKKFSDLDNLERLCSLDNKVIYEALIEKRNWINRKVILPGNIFFSIHEDGKEHCDCLEDLFNNVINFEKVIYSNSKISLEEMTRINQQLDGLNVATFKTRINLRDNYPFYIEYDLSKIEDNVYKILMPNFYYKHFESFLNINFADISTSDFDRIKTCIIGNEDEVCILLPDNELLHQKFYLPVVSKIIVARQIPEELMQDLYNFAKNNNCEIEVLYENRDN